MREHPLQQETYQRAQQVQDNPRIHVHGYAGNFYGNNFVHVIGESVTQDYGSFLTIETRGSYDQQALHIDKKPAELGGAYLEKLEAAYLDIDAWITFLLNKGYRNIVLQGHSLGTYKVVRYMHEGKNKQFVQKLILLCPFEAFACAEKDTQGQLTRYLAEAKKQVELGNSLELIPQSWNTMPMSYATMLSWYNNTSASHCFDYAQADYQSDYLHQIAQPVSIIVGSKDEYFSPHNPDHPEISLEKLRSQFPQAVAALIPGAHHSFRGYEKVVAEKVKIFVCS